MSPANEVQQHDVQVERFRKDDFEDLEAWAQEVGVTTDQLAEQILKKATQYLAQRRERKSSNVVLFAAPR
ncbi:hypothetical protein [Pseudomonas chlororaphis]|uniref:hypothetical protein n=1 Tax=Pseudomonas chlororaphis TaxID=587753 RepID=UPI0006A5BB35|nr:hypothetical protein [Pseudomonas chlororaphis]AZD01361.1 hypothetical protein C4K27_2167 [Pseudomonas chlororaphis subsp. chlororaphis]MBM0285038.1 hypothetical protein [Pseudomonas chlororaphis]MDO1505711.1 hypothetical protein [Pseudomonas chlororaphis]ORM49823.1 hypothetical protein B6D51_01390 [Pseudomonas chlororaphis subsp. chlororaphis]TWR99100.1 hypothetical protein FJD36_03800 [Pseudomonas chlororaphis subsp. chlororaphis]